MMLQEQLDAIACQFDYPRAEKAIELLFLRSCSHGPAIGSGKSKKCQ